MPDEEKLNLAILMITAWADFAKVKVIISSYKYCEVCGIQIPEERLEVLPETNTCILCSHVEPKTEATPGVIPIEDTIDLLASMQSAPHTEN